MPDPRCCRSQKKPGPSHDHDKTCIHRNTTAAVHNVVNPISIGCKFLPCYGATFHKTNANRTKFKNKFDTVFAADTSKNPSFKEVFLGDFMDDFKNMTKPERNDLKKSICREYRGQKLKFKKTDEDELDYDAGGIKVFKKFKNPDRDFMMIDKPEFDDIDAVELQAGEAFFFEDEAEFKRGSKNFT